MQFGIAIPTDADSWRVVRRAEELGFARAWFYDTQMLSADPFVAMAAAALKTTTIRLATGVLIPSNRIAAVAANAFASLNKLAPGRIDFGVGTGFSARRAMGIGAMKLADMEEYIRVVYGLLNGETLETNVEGKRRTPEPRPMVKPQHRIEAGIAKAREQGKKFGRPSALDVGQKRKISEGDKLAGTISRLGDAVHQRLVEERLSALEQAQSPKTITATTFSGLICTGQAEDTRPETGFLVARSSRRVIERAMSCSMA